MSLSFIQGVLPTTLDKETEVKQKVSWMPHAAMGTKEGIKNDTNEKFIIFFVYKCKRHVTIL
jgi:hypothetical protein